MEVISKVERTTVRCSLDRMVRSHLWLAGDNDPLRNPLRRGVLVKVPCTASTDDILDDAIAAGIRILSRLNSDPIFSDRMQGDDRVAEVRSPRNQPTYLANISGRQLRGIAPPNLSNTSATTK